MALEPGHPFTEPTADIVLCSSNNVLFRLHKIILSLASEFFRDMLSLPQPESTPSTSRDCSAISELDGIPVLHVSESSDVLERLFRLCYPIDDPVLETIGEVSSTLEAAMKYQMAEAFKITKRRLLTLAPMDPLRVYAVACRFGLEEEASAAAAEVLKQKTQDRYVEELEELPIGAYHRLLSFCEARDGMRSRIRFTLHRAGGREQPSASSTTPSTPSSTPSITKASLETDDLAHPKVAPHPFDVADAEVSIVTSDDVEFRVSKDIIQLSSSVFSSQLTALPPSAPKVISVSEPSRTLSVLLEICYPTPNPDVTNLHDIVDALTAADKYEMLGASQVLRSALTALKDVPSEDPVLLYFIACRFGMRELAVTAARRTLRSEIMQLSTPVSDLDALGVSGGCFYRLLDYHRRCRAAARSIVDTDTWIDAALQREMVNHCRAKFRTTSCWYDPYMIRLEAEDWPSGESVTDLALLQSVIISKSCADCSDLRGTFLFIKLSKCLAAAIDTEERGVSPCEGRWISEVLTRFHARWLCSGIHRLCLNRWKVLCAPDRIFI